MFVTFRTQLKQKFCFLAIQLHIANLINHQQSWTQVDSPASLQMSPNFCFLQVGNEPGRGGIVHHHSCIRGSKCQTNRQVRLAYARRSQKNHILISSYKGQRPRTWNLCGKCQSGKLKVWKDMNWAKHNGIRSKICFHRSEKPREATPAKSNREML